MPSPAKSNQPPSPHGTAPQPRNPLTGQPVPQSDQPGYYPGYSTLSQQSFWDPTTRKVVLDRITECPPLRFFTEPEQTTLTCVLEHALPQSDRAPSRRIPILPFIDKRLFEHTIGGFRYEDMPPDWDAYRIALEAIETMAHEVHGRSFPACSYEEREALLKSLNDGKPVAAHELWKKMNVKRFWRMVLHDASATYYAHPWAWDEIGFGGPAYPRGYMRLEAGRPEPWEVDEERYPWAAPEGCLSDLEKKF